ncbi:MAG: hypothetical protein WAU75_22450 [Solirubrobacteraceae bacterium]
MSTIAIIVLVVAVLGVTVGLLLHLGYGIKLDADHRRRLGRRDRARARRAGRRI